MLTKLMTNSPAAPAIPDQAVISISNAFALEAKALSDLLQVETEILRKATKNAANLDEFVAINESVNGVLDKMSEIRKMTKNILLHINAALDNEKLNEEMAND